MLDLKSIVSLDLRREEDRLSVFVSMAEALRTAGAAGGTLLRSGTRQASKEVGKPVAGHTENRRVTAPAHGCPCGILCMHKESAEERGHERRVPLVSLLNAEEEVEDKSVDTKLRRLHR